MAAETPGNSPETHPADHHDEMLHRIVAFCDRAEPLLERAEQLLARWPAIKRPVLKRGQS
jgi:hypothetical protein